MNSTYIFRYSSPLGGITLAGEGGCITGLWFDGQKYFGRTLFSDAGEGALAVFDEAESWLDVYFSGREPSFMPPLAPYGTDFQKAVFALLLEIPYGDTVTYGEIASRLAGRFGLSGMSAQAVGGAVGRNPISLMIPCHRVIGADGGLTGYAGGIERKEALLRMEGALK